MNGSNKPKESPFFNANGKLVLLRLSGMSLSKVAEAPIGHWSQGVAFSPDGKSILVGNMVEKDYWVFNWDGTALRDTTQRVKVNGGPAAIRTADK
jgi:sugar lactone lactonase YvrE